MEFRWNELKNKRLKRSRGASFEEVIGGRLVALRRHERLENQQILLFYYREYIWAVPCVAEAGGVFLKTLYRSRKFTKKYLKGEYEKNQTDKI